jgi:hypothetical protein
MSYDKPYEHKEGRGNLFVNTEQRPDKKDPDRQGDFKLGDKLYKIAGWISRDDEGNVKKDARGNPFLNIAVSEKQMKAAQPQPQPAVVGVEDDVPF